MRKGFAALLLALLVVIAVSFFPEILLIDFIPQITFWFAVILSFYVGYDKAGKSLMTVPAFL
jgi:hypothetical protein